MPKKLTVIVLKDISVLIKKGDIMIKKGQHFVLKGYEKGDKEIIQKTTDHETGKVTTDTYWTPTFYDKERVLNDKEYFKILR